MERCPHCDTQLIERANYCDQCGLAIVWEWVPDSAENDAASTDSTASIEQVAEVVPPPASEPLPFPENVAAAISYVTIVPAAAFLYLKPFSRNRFVRFHAVQHLLVFVAAIACAAAAMILWTVLELIPPMRVLVFPFAALVGLAWFFLWLLLVVKAYHHEWFKLPWIGDFADEWSRY